jgi:hypothetical protein
MGYRLAVAALLLPLAGCVVAPPPGPGPYPPPGAYPPPPGPYGQPGYPPPDAMQEPVYPGYAYNNGSPTLVVEGVTWPLIFWGGAWGYWDGFHHWHGAPGPIGGWLNRRHPGGVGYHPYGGGQFGRPVGFRGAYGPAGGYHGGAPGGGRPAAPQRHREEEHR